MRGADNLIAMRRRGQRPASGVVLSVSSLPQRQCPHDPDAGVFVILSKRAGNVVAQAIGYIRGTCNVIPMVKPEAFAASYAADRYKSLRVA